MSGAASTRAKSTSDEELVSSSCIVTSDFAVLSNGPEPLSAGYWPNAMPVEGVSGEGVIGAVVYCHPWRDLDGRPVHVGDTYSDEAAREVVQRPEFQDRLYSRCWKSAVSITVDTWHYLANLADLATPGEYAVHRLSGAVQPGDRRSKLISTPWTDQRP